MKLTILHTNDLHGHLEHWDLLSRYLAEQQMLASEKNEALLTLDIGDAMDSVHPLVEATYGKIIVDVFNQANYDIVTIGNNEGLNFDKERLMELYARANFEVTVANVLDNETDKVPSYAQAIIYRKFGPIRIAMIGLTAPYITYNLNGYKIIEPAQALQAQLDQLEKDTSVDLVVVLSHLGITTDRYLANLFPQIDLIIGAHTHHVLVDGDWENNTFLCAAGKYGHYVGKIELFFDELTKDWNMEAETLTIEQLSQRYQLPKQNHQHELIGRRTLRKRVVAHLPHSFSALDLTGKQSFIQFTLDAIAKSVKLDYALLNSGLFLSDLPSGIITENDLHEALPHPMHLCVVTLHGNHLIDLLNSIMNQTEDMRYKMISGLGFRGKIFGEVIYKGFYYNETDKLWYAKDKPIDDNETYQFVTVDHLWFLPYFPTIDQFGSPKLIFPDFIRHCVRNYLEKLYPIESR